VSEASKPKGASRRATLREKFAKMRTNTKMKLAQQELKIKKKLNTLAEKKQDATLQVQ